MKRSRCSQSAVGVLSVHVIRARVAELADAPHSKCGIERCVGSSPTSGTVFPQVKKLPPVSSVAKACRRGQFGSEYRGPWSRSSKLDHRAAGAGLKVPTLAAYSDADPSCPAELGRGIAHTAPNGQPAVFRESGHATPFGEPVRFAEVLREFVSP